MSSSKAEGRGALGFLADPELGFDPDDVLVREPGLLLDPAFLRALRDELEDEMGADEARLTLLQMGFLHGLCEALQVVGRTMTTPSAPVVASVAVRPRTASGASGRSSAPSPRARRDRRRHLVAEVASKA